MSAATVDVTVPSHQHRVPRLRLVDPRTCRRRSEWWRAPRTRAQAYRRRLAVAVVVAVGMALAAGSAPSQPGPLVVPVATASVVVQPGDTLWSVAAAHAPEGGSVPAYVAALVEVNELEGAGLRAWQVLRLPPGG